MFHVYRVGMFSSENGETKPRQSVLFSTLQKAEEEKDEWIETYRDMLLASRGRIWVRIDELEVY
jgi:hypothetical protein